VKYSFAPYFFKAKTNMKKKIIITFLIAVIIGVGAAVWYVFFKPHRDVGSETAAFTLSADSLSTAFKTNPNNANTTYINKAVLLEGMITNIEGVTISLNNVACNLDSTELTQLGKYKVGDKIKLQGLVVGYNDLLEETNLAQCVFKK